MAAVDRAGRTLLEPRDFAMAPVSDLRECPWWRPVRVAVAPGPALDPLLGRLVGELIEAFRAQGHTVDATSGVDILLAQHRVPDGRGPLAERVVERERPLLLTSPSEFGLSSRPAHVVTLVSLPEPITDRSHEAVVECARLTMARLGSPKIVFVTGDRDTGTVSETTLCTMEGGHPTDAVDCAATVRDRLVTAACAREVGGDYEVVESGLDPEVWRRTEVPDALTKAGRRMDDLGLLPAPQRVDSYVSSRLAARYERLLGLAGFSEGMLFAFDPGSQTMMVTASGSWDVDKRALRREEVVCVDVRSRGGTLRVLAPPGAAVKGPSVEAHEMLTLLQSVPRITLGRTAAGGWRPDPDGDVEAPVVRAGIHVHVGVVGIDPGEIESLPANRRLFPYGFGCGTDLMHEVVRDMARRSAAMHDPRDARSYVRWPMLYHGDTMVELWRPDSAEQPLQGLLDLFADGAIDYTASHIEQPV